MLLYKSDAVDQVVGFIGGASPTPTHAPYGNPFCCAEKCDAGDTGEEGGGDDGCFGSDQFCWSSEGEGCQENGHGESDACQNAGA